MGARLTSLVVAASVALLSLVAVALAKPNQTSLASRANGANGAAANADAVDPALAGNASAVAFSSSASNLGKGSSGADVFLRDLNKDKVELISRKSGGSGAPVPGVSPAISKTGRYVVFESNGDILVRDRAEKKTVKANKPSGACGPNGYEPDISANGKVVAWQMASPGAIFTNPGNHVCVVDLDAKKPKAVIADRASGNNGAISEGSAFRPTLSANGSRVSFEAFGSNLPDANGFAQIYLRDLEKGKTFLVSRADGADGAAGVCGGALCDSQFAVISDDGQRVAFTSFADNLDSAAVTSVAGIRYPNVYLRDLGNNQTQLVSRDDGASGAGADFDSDSAAISGDGRYVAFRSRALNLREPFDTPEDGAAGFQVFVRDLQTQQTIGVSRQAGPEGNFGSGESSSPSVSAKGVTVAFQSDSTFGGVGGTGSNGANLEEVWLRDLGGAD
jgi:Tol biopolymer transport system component